MELTKDQIEFIWQFVPMLLAEPRLKKNKKAREEFILLQMSIFKMFEGSSLEKVRRAVNEAIIFYKQFRPPISVQQQAILDYFMNDPGDDGLPVFSILKRNHIIAHGDDMFKFPNAPAKPVYTKPIYVYTYLREKFNANNTTTAAASDI